MHKNDIYIVILRPRTLTPKRELDVLRAISPAGPHRKRQDTHIPAYHVQQLTIEHTAMQRCADMLHSRRLRSRKRPRLTLKSCSEAHQKHRTRMQCSELPTNDRTEHNARGTHSSSQHAKGGGGSSVQNSPRSATNPEAPRRGRDPKSRRSPKSSSTGRACEH